MDGQRIGIAPACLYLLAAGALGFSWYLAANADHEPDVAQAAPPVRSDERRPLRWPIDRLAHLSTVELDDLDVGQPEAIGADVLQIRPPRLVLNEESASLNAIAALPVRFTAPAHREPPGVSARSGPSLGAALATPAEDDGPTPRFVVLLPAPAALSAAFTPTPDREAWSVFGLDSLSVAEQVGRRFGELSGGGLQNTPQTQHPARGRREPTREARRRERAVSSPAGPVIRRLPARRVSVRTGVPAPTISVPSIERYLADGTEGGVFPTPIQLGSQLSRLADSADAAGWAWAVAYRMRGLVGSRGDDELAVRKSLAALARARAEVDGMANATPDEGLATELRRSRYALDRRLATWNAMLNDRGLAPREAAVAERRREWLAGARWAMRPLGGSRLSGGAWPAPAAVRHDPSAAARLARRLERYEADPSGVEARAIVVDATDLVDSGDDVGLALASVVQRHYRNANLRLAVATDLLERLLPPPQTKMAVIRDRIAGAPVQGRSRTQTHLAIVPTPDESAWRLAIRAHGTVQSDTLSRGGPAVLRSRGATEFRAEKRVTVGPVGLTAAPATARAATSSSRLTGLRTRYDHMPIVGSYARSTARRQYASKQRIAGAQVRSKIERRVSSELDAQVGSALARLEGRYRADVLGRLRRLNLRVEPVELRTTDSRLIGRVRIAGAEQLAAHTPRMRAPSDSVLSLQVHESALNNAIEGLGLAGKRMTVAELRERLVAKLDLTPNETPDAESDAAVVRFADVDPIRVAFEDGRARLTVSLAEMIVRGKRHRDFKVHAFFHPSAEGLNAALVQNGAAQIEGRMRSSTRLRLHAVVGKVFGEDREIHLVPESDRLSAEIAAKLTGLVTSQFVIEDGWMGIAVAPSRPTGSVAARVGSYVR